MMAYLFPICFFVGAAFFVSNKDNGIAIVKLTAGVVFVVFLCLFMELIAGDSKEYQVQKSFQYAVEHKSGGGAAGGLLASLLCPAIGVAGAYVALWHILLAGKQFFSQLPGKRFRFLRQLQFTDIIRTAGGHRHNLRIQRNSFQTELDEVLSEGTEQLWRPKGDPLLTGDEPVVIHSEPSGGAGQELPEFGSHMANGFSEADFSEEAFAGLESAIIAETDHGLQTEPGYFLSGAFRLRFHRHFQNGSRRADLACPPS